MKDRVVVITGASSGIGAALASAIVRRGGIAALVARRERELEAARAPLGDRGMAIVADVTKRGDIERAIRGVLERFSHIDVLVNNAGRGIWRAVSELTDEDFDEMMLVNVKSMLYGVQAVLPHFKARGAGHIVNVSSMLGRAPFAPARSAYSASKHALNSLSANLRMELAATHPGIHVSVVHPGVVATEFGLNAKHGGMDSRKFPGAQSADDVAEIIADVIEHPRADVYTRKEGRETIVAYYSAEDMAAIEAGWMHR